MRCIELRKVYDNAVEYYTATPIVPTPTPLTLRRLTSGVWKISERVVPMTRDPALTSQSHQSHSL